MPTVSVIKNDVEAKLGSISEDEFNDLCFEFGLELDEITSEYEMVCKEQGEEKALNCSKDVIYKVDVPANRYDLLCVEGLTRALAIFKSKTKSPKYILNPEIPKISLTVSDEVKSVRPYVVGAILRNVSLTSASYTSFIALQEKLHANIGRKRSLVSIGTHDLDTLTPPFTYSARAPNQISFVPLNETKEFRADELMEYYSAGESHLKPYLNIIRDFPIYPVIEDSKGIICSLPPIINGNHSKIQVDTKNIFIEITATNQRKASVTLDIIVAMFSEYCAEPFRVEPINVITSNGLKKKYPKLPYRIETVSVDYINKTIGCLLKSSEIAQILERMGLGIAIATNDLLQVEIPPTRQDILHRCDIMEDVSIGLGFDNIPRHPVKTFTTGGDTALNKLTYAVRLEMVKNGFTEALSFVLCSRDDIATKLGRKIEDLPAVHVGNPKTLEFQVARTTLLPGILATIQSNQHLTMPLSLFEVQDVVLRGLKSKIGIGSEVGACNQRRLAAVRFGMVPEFELLLNIQWSVLDAIGLKYVSPDERDKLILEKGKLYYTLSEIDSEPSMLPGRMYTVKLLGDQDIELGRIGILHPDVLRAFKIKKGWASALELNLEPLL